MHTFLASLKLRKDEAGYAPYTERYQQLEMKEINPNRIKFYEFLNGDIERDELEQWIYSTKQLENDFPEDHYFDLISFPYKTGNVKQYVTKIVNNFFDYKEFEFWRTTNLLQEISEGKIETVLASRKLRNLYKEQEEALERPLITIRLGIGFESAMDGCPVETEYKLWNPVSLKEKLKTVSYYKDDLTNTAKIELNELISNEVKSIDMSQVVNNKHLHNLFAEKLHFPKFYGNNWDALWDSITGLVEMPKKLILYNWDQFQTELPKDASTLKELVEEYNTEMNEKKIEIKAGNKVQNAHSR